MLQKTSGTKNAIINPYITRSKKARRLTDRPFVLALFLRARIANGLMRRNGSDRAAGKLAAT